MTSFAAAEVDGGLSGTESWTAPAFWLKARICWRTRWMDWRVLAMVLLGGDAGLRMSEVIGLEWTDIDWKRGFLHVQRGVWKGYVSVPKGGRSRRVPMTIELGRVLKANRHMIGPRVLYTNDGTDLNRNCVRRWLTGAQRRANLPRDNGGMHILRHTFCSHLAMRGATVKAIQELAGHQQLSTTQRYMHLSPAVKDEAIALLNNRPQDRGAERSWDGKRVEPATRQES